MPLQRDSCHSKIRDARHCVSTARVFLHHCCSKEEAPKKGGVIESQGGALVLLFLFTKKLVYRLKSQICSHSWRANQEAAELGFARVLLYWCVKRVSMKKKLINFDFPAFFCFFHFFEKSIPILTASDACFFKDIDYAFFHSF